MKTALLVFGALLAAVPGEARSMPISVREMKPLFLTLEPPGVRSGSPPSAPRGDSTDLVAEGTRPLAYPNSRHVEEVPGPYHIPVVAGELEQSARIIFLK